VHNMCLVRPALLYLNVHVSEVFYEQINYYYYYYIYAAHCRRLYITGSKFSFLPSTYPEMVYPIKLATKNRPITNVA